MNSKNRRWGLRLAAALLCLAPLAFAGTVNMKLTGDGGNIMAGVYVNPYDGLIDNVAARLICNSFSAETYMNETWIAEEYQVSNLPTEKADDADKYKQVAWLAIQLLAESNSETRGYISFAIWSIFDSADDDALDYLEAHEGLDARGEAEHWVERATQDAPAGSFSNVYIYTPVGNPPPVCPTPTGACPSGNTPQEFIVVRAPEASSVAMLAVNLLAVAGLVTFLRRRRTI